MDETEKGWFIQYIDRDPKKIEKQAQAERNEKADLDEEVRVQRLIDAQIAAAAKDKGERDTDAGAGDDEEEAVFDPSSHHSISFEFKLSSAKSKGKKPPLKRVVEFQDRDGHRDRGVGVSSAIPSLSSAHLRNVEQGQAARIDTEGGESVGEEEREQLPVEVEEDEEVFYDGCDSEEEDREYPREECENLGDEMVVGCGTEEDSERSDDVGAEGGAGPETEERSRTGNIPQPPPIKESELPDPIGERRSRPSGQMSDMDMDVDTTVSSEVGAGGGGLGRDGAAGKQDVKERVRSTVKKSVQGLHHKEGARDPILSTAGTVGMGDRAGRGGSGSTIDGGRMEEAGKRPKETVAGPRPGGSMLEQLMREEESARIAAMETEDRRSRRDYWLHPGIQVKIMSKTVGGGKFYKTKGDVLAVLERYVGEVRVVVDGKRAVLRIDQQELQTVIPKVTGIQCLIVRASLSLSLHLLLGRCVVAEGGG